MSRQSEKSNKVRIIGGTLRSRLITFPTRPGLRPTADRIRETLFNWLQQDIVSAHCLDLFAGSGALGIEALSRGAAVVDLVESDAAVAAAIGKNLADLGLQAGRVHVVDADDWLRRRQEPEARYHVAFLDPPYADKRLGAVCQGLEASQLLRDQAKIYLESDEPICSDSIPPNWENLKQKKAGQVYYYLYQNRTAN